MGPDAKLCIAEPLRNAVGIERAACPLNGPGSGGVWPPLGQKHPWSCPSRRIAQQFYCVAPGKPHGESPPYSCRKIKFASKKKHQVFRPWLYLCQASLSTRQGQEPKGSGRPTRLRLRTSDSAHCCFPRRLPMFRRAGLHPIHRPGSHSARRRHPEGIAQRRPLFRPSCRRPGETMVATPLWASTSSHCRLSSHGTAAVMPTRSASTV